MNVIHQRLLDGFPLSFLPALDNYSVGVILYELMTLSHPFCKEPNIQGKYLPINPELNFSSKLVELVYALMALDPETRPSSAEALRVLQSIEEENAGDVIGHYRIKDRISKGGSGTIFLAEDSSGKDKEKRMVAMKLIELDGTDATQQRAFDAELRVGLHLGAKCRFLMDYEEVLKTPPTLRMKYGPGFFLVMQYCSGGDLARLIQRRRESPLAQRKYFSDREILRLVVQVGRAVQTLHREGIVHRDLKPDNIFLTADGVYLVGDFSISRVLDSRRKTTNAPAATVGYASPEFLNGDLEYAREKDVYSFGCILIEFIDLCHPFGNESGYLQQGRIFTGKVNGARAGLSLTAKAIRDFALGMINHEDPSRRPSIDMLLQQPAVLDYLFRAYEACADASLGRDGE